VCHKNTPHFSKQKMMFSLLSRSSRMMMRGSKFSNPTKCRYFSSEFDHETFVSDMLEQVKDVPTATDPFQSSEILRSLVKSNVLSYWDMKENPEKFFMAHRLLATVGLGGFGIRFTVQFNLFAGSIVGLAGPDQLGVLDDLQKSGELGCFLLTENQAGVLSGFIVETTAKWDPSTQEFVLNTPNDAAAKNWISQGYTAEHGVVIADLQVDGKSYGPHPFLMRLRDDDGNLCDGIRIDDMGDKTVANDLDNARVWFSNVKLPHGSLLNKFADIQDDKYVQVGDEPMRIEVIGQRLMTGRQAIAEAALVSAKVLHMKTEEYAKTKICNGINGETTLLKMPQLKSVFDRSYRELDDTIAFVAGVENRLNDCLRNERIPDDDLVDAIAVAKIRCIDVAIQCVHRLRQEVGSYALTGNTGFELVDMFLCCKFAEGDSRILQMKLARDRMKKLKKDGMATAVMQSIFDEETRTALSLGRKFAAAGKDLDKLADAMNTNWEEMYRLADLVADRIQAKSPKAEFLEPIVERYQPYHREYDFDWKSKLGKKRDVVVEEEKVVGK